jgi:DNA-binding IscR family transcriptional regulator
MNTQFTVAVHILTFLDTRCGQPTTSELISSSVNTNPSTIRRLLGLLAKAGLTRSIMGTGGGALLGRDATAITLLDVYLAILGDDVDAIPIHATANPKCPVGRHIQRTLKARLDEVERVLRAELSRSTIADVSTSIVDIEPSLAAMRNAHPDSPLQ